MSAPVITRARLALIQFVGLLNLTFGGLYVALGLWILLSGADAVVNLVQARQQIGQVGAQVPVQVDAKVAKTGGDILDAASKGLGGFIMAVASIFAGCSIVQGLPLVLVGGGVLLRLRWARVFALFFAALALLEGASCLASRNSTPLLFLVGAVLVGYGVISFVALLGRGAGAYFARRDAETAGESVAAGPSLAAAAGVMVVLAAGAVAGGWYLSRPAATTAIAPDGSSAKRTLPVAEFDDADERYRQRVAALADAIKRGQISRVEELIKNGAGANDRDKKGETPLMKAVQSGYADLCPLLIKKGANIRATDAEGNDVFLHAAARGKVRFLLEAIAGEAAPIARVRIYSLGSWAAVLIDDVNHQNMTAAMLAAANGHLEDLRWMMGRMGDVRGQVANDGLRGLEADWLARTDKDGKTALDHARAKGHTKVVTYLESLASNTAALEKKEEKKPIRAEQVAALAKAVAAADAEAVDRILRPATDEAKVELMRSPDADGKTPLMHAAAKGDMTVVMLLQQTIRQRGLISVVAATDKGQRTALHYAAQGGHTEALAKLLDLVSTGWLSYESGAEGYPVHWFRCIRQRDKDGKTAVDLARAGNHKETVELLERYVMKQFLTPTYRNVTVLEIACWAGDLALVKDLLKTGCPLMRPAADQAKSNTPLMQACFGGHLLVVKTLLDSVGGNKQKLTELVNFRVGNNTALSAALQVNQPEIAALLRAHGAKEK